MSGSHRTQPARKQAQRRLERAKHGIPALPRIVVRKPKPGCAHPLSRQLLAAILAELPIEYVVGLRTIELRHHEPHQLALGEYVPTESTIILYAQPLATWRRGSLTAADKRWVEAYGASVARSMGMWTITWARPVDAAMFFLFEVFLHELGHHFVRAYDTKHKLPATRKGHELLADVHMRRLRHTVKDAFT